MPQKDFFYRRNKYSEYIDIVSTNVFEIHNSQNIECESVFKPFIKL